MGEGAGKGRGKTIGVKVKKRSTWRRRVGEDDLGKEQGREGGVVGRWEGDGEGGVTKTKSFQEGGKGGGRW